MDVRRLRSDLREAHREVALFFEALPVEEAFRRVGDAWAPIDDVRHLTLATSALTRALGLPGDVLAEKFGRPLAPSRTREQVDGANRAGLAAGARSADAFVPDPIPEREWSAEGRAGVVRAWEEEAAALEEAVARWGPEDLERHQLPHPFLGMLTLTEWIHFSVLHARHHIGVAERRRHQG